MNHRLYKSPGRTTWGERFFVLVAATIGVIIFRWLLKQCLP